MEKMETQETAFLTPAKIGKGHSSHVVDPLLALVRNSFCTAAIWVCAATDKI